MIIGLVLLTINSANADELNCKENDGDLRVLIIQKFGVYYTVYIDNERRPIKQFDVIHSFTQNQYMAQHIFRGNEGIILLNLFSPGIENTEIEISSGTLILNPEEIQSVELYCKRKLTT